MADHGGPDTYNELLTKRLKFPAYDIVGNHDEGGKSPSDTIKNWIVKRHGSLSYTFDCRGVHFVALFSKYNENLNNPAQPVAPEALDFLRKDLAKVSPATPVIVALHLCQEAITNRDGTPRGPGTKSNVLLVLGGTLSQIPGGYLQGNPFPPPASPAANGEAIHGDPDRLGSPDRLAFRYRTERWADRPEWFRSAHPGSKFMGKKEGK